MTKIAVSRIRTGVVTATTWSTNHYTNTADWYTCRKKSFLKHFSINNKYILFFLISIWNLKFEIWKKKITPARGIEPRASAWQAEMLPTTPSRKERGYYRIRTGDRRICNPMLCHWAKHPSLNFMQKNSFIWKIFWFTFLLHPISTFKRLHKNIINLTKKKGAQGDSNPRPLAPKARIIPLDHWPTREARGIRTPNLRVWNPTRYRCAIASGYTTSNLE